MLAVVDVGIGSSFHWHGLFFFFSPISPYRKNLEIEVAPMQPVVLLADLQQQALFNRQVRIVN